MKTYGTTLVLMMASALLFTALPCGATEKDDGNFRLNDKPKQDHRRFELTDERIERIMGRLAKNDPNKAKELKQLRQDDPKKFKAELRETMREKFGKRFGQDNMRERPGRMSRGRNMREQTGKRFDGRKRFELTDERIERIMGRLAENDPNKAKELEQLRQKDPKKFKAELKETMREKFGKRFREHKGYKQKKK